ncbi:MAG: serine hydrolase domain-containing protein [Pyrinomonadaceae bacterium]
MSNSNSTRDESINQLLAESIEAGDFPSAVYLVAESGRIIYSDALGAAVTEPVPHAATIETIYDLASLTKPLITGLLCARFVERGELKLEHAVAAYLPEFARQETITVRHLLTHSSGLPAWRPLRIATEDRRERVLAIIAGSNLEHAPGTHVLYSDLGFITLGLLLEKIAGAPLDELARRDIFQPLQLTRTSFNPDCALLAGIAACELAGNAYERGMCEAAGEQTGMAGAWRAGIIWGEVHDGNAHFLGGAAGHAGLFSTARETFRLAEQFIAGRTQLLAPQTCSLFCTDMTPHLNEARSFAWQLAATKDSTAGDRLPPDGFGHLGFTGTSCWLDPVCERIFVLLTNRTHTRTLPFVNINRVRRQFHALAVAALERTGERSEAI